MKLIFLLLSLCSFAGVSAQTSYSCTHRSYCYRDSTAQKYKDCNGYDENSLFEWNKDQTMFNHTIASMQSAYYVKSKEYDKENDVWIYDVVSDVGNKYRYCFDDKNKEVRATFISEGKWTLLTFWVKAVF
jgi:hypothetical protein